MKLRYLMSLMLFYSVAFANPNPDCSQVINQPSETWITQTSEKQGGGSTLAITDAIAQYGNCVDQNTQAIYEQLLKSGNYPLMGAKGNFEDFTEALQNFTNLALKVTATGGTWDNLQGAYVQLYQKQFKLLFYQAYLGKNQNPILERINNTQRPGLQAAQAYYDEILRNYSPENQKALTSAFNQLLTIATTQNGFKKEYIYYYAIYMLQPISDSSFAPPPF